MLIKTKNYKRMLRLLIGLPGLKQYIQLLKFVQRKIKLQAISKSHLIQKSPSESFIKLCQSYPCYFYVPWVEALTNKLIEQLDHSTQDFRLVPFSIFSNTHLYKNRKKINFFTQYNNQELNKIILAWLKPVAHHIRGFIFTFDYGFLQRQIIRICQQLAIPTILIPHESVFFNRDKYYLHPITGINTPLCDYVLCWGGLQKDIFISRGYPAERIKIVGAPKFDRYYHYQPQLSRKEFCKRAMLDSNQPIILFAAQTLDFQVQQQVALAMQRRIIAELINYCEDKKCEFILRCPPTAYQILDDRLIMQMKSAHFFIDAPSPSYHFDPEETIYHADIIVSINSTMLFEALLMGKRALSVKYFDFNEDWQRAGIPCVFNKEQLTNALNEWLQDKQGVQLAPNAWAVQSFSPHGFDGQATQRIIEFLKSITIYPLNAIPSAIWRFIHGEKPAVDLVYFPDLGSPFRYISQLLPVKKIVTSPAHNLQNWVEINCQVRSRKSLNLTNLFPKVYIERGILCFGQEWTSIILDDLAYYNEGTKHTRLQTFLESKIELTKNQFIEAELSINKIISNQFPFEEITLSIQDQKVGRLGKPKILLVDEYMELPCLLIEDSFKKMLADVVKDYPDYDILIKPPSASPQRKKTYLKDTLINNYLKHHDHIYVMNPSYNIYNLFSQVEQLFVVNSLIGFWGLIMGKQVNCYGSPFYANWGLTNDCANLVRRKRTRTLIDLFYFSCIYLSRYYSPLLDRKCSLSEYIDYIFYLQKQTYN